MVNAKSTVGANASDHPEHSYEALARGDLVCFLATRIRRLAFGDDGGVA